jgi:hypothetical protein
LQLRLLCLFFLLFFIFCHKSLFFRIFYDLYIPSASLVHISGVIIISLLVCSVSVHSHRTWHCESVIPFIRGPWVALVYPVLSLEITTCSLLVIPLVSPSYSCSIFLPFMLLLPFLHRFFLIFVVSVFYHFLRSFGGYSSFCCMSSSSAAFASSFACSFPGMPICPGTYRSVICFLFRSMISLNFIVFGFLV